MANRGKGAGGPTELEGVLAAFGKIEPAVKADVFKACLQFHEARGLERDLAAGIAALQATYLAGEPWREALERASEALRARLQPYFESIEPWALQLLREQDELRGVVLYYLRVWSVLRFNHYVEAGAEAAWYESPEHQRSSEILDAFGGEPEELPVPEDFQRLVVAFHRRMQMKVVPGGEK